MEIYYAFFTYFPIFYGGHVIETFNNTITVVSVLYNNGSTSEMFHLTGEDSYALLLQKQNMIGHIRFRGNIWIIDYYPLNTIDSNGKIR